MCGCADAGHAGDPVQGSIMYQKSVKTMSWEIKDKNTSKNREEEVRTATTNSVNDPLHLRAVLPSSNAATFSWSLKQHNNHSTAAMVKITWFRPFPSLIDAENKN